MSVGLPEKFSTVSRIASRGCPDSGRDRRDHAQFEEMKPRFLDHAGHDEFSRLAIDTHVQLMRRLVARCVRASHTATARASENSGAPLLSRPQRTSSSSNPSSQPEPAGIRQGHRTGVHRSAHGRVPADGQTTDPGFPDSHAARRQHVEAQHARCPRGRHPRHRSSRRRGDASRSDSRPAAPRPCRA